MYYYECAHGTIWELVDDDELFPENERWAIRKFAKDPAYPEMIKCLCKPPCDSNSIKKDEYKEAYYNFMITINERGIEIVDILPDCSSCGERMVFLSQNVHDGYRAFKFILQCQNCGDVSTYTLYFKEINKIIDRIKPVSRRLSKYTETEYIILPLETFI